MSVRLTIALVGLGTTLLCCSSSAPTTTPSDADANAGDKSATVDADNDQSDPLATDYGHTDHVQEATPADTLTTENFELTVQNHMSEVLECYVEAQVKSPQLTGQLLATFTIAGDGSATGVVAAEGSTLVDAQLLSCVEARARQWTFAPTPDKSTMEMTYPFELSPD